MIIQYRISNLPFDTSEEEIFTMFQEYGTIQSIKMPRDRIHRNFKGVAFITLRLGRENSKRLLNELNNAIFSNRKITVKLNRCNNPKSCDKKTIRKY